VSRSRLVAALVITLLAVPLLVRAASQPFDDPNDTKGVLDVKQVRMTAGETAIWRTISFSRFRAFDMWDAGYVMVHIDSFGDARFDHYALIYSDGGGFRGDLYRDRQKKSDYRISSLKVWRKDRTSISVRIPLSKLNLGDDRIDYRWIVKTLFTSENCRKVCIDRIPDAGAVTQLRPEVTPTPTPTATPTEPPSPEPSP
jgi:hypothetical protein